MKLWLFYISVPNFKLSVLSLKTRYYMCRHPDNEGQHSNSVFIRLKESSSQNRVDALSLLSQCSGKANFEQFT